MSRFLFLKEYLKNLRVVGSLTPSSRSLARIMIEPLDPSRAKCVVELGSGDGIVTKAILERISPHSRLLAFETNPRFLNTLSNIKDPRLTIIPDSAEKIGHYLPRYGYNRADCVISSLPLTSLPHPLPENVLRAVQSALLPGGLFVQFQYSLASRKDFQRRFRSVRVEFTPWNFPPAFVYVCKQ